MNTGAKLIAKERTRQIRKEGWRAEHDDTHCKGELARAARCYLAPKLKEDSETPREWPWDIEWWKPSDDKIKNLVRAGALIAAEIDRLKRNKFPR